MIGVIKMSSEYLKHKFSAFKGSLVGSFLSALLSYFSLSLLVKSSYLFESVSFVYNFLVIGLVLLLIYCSSMFCVAFLYLLFGGGIRRDFYGNIELDFMNLFNIYVFKAFPKEFKESAKFLERKLE